jgi:hypothetical protein
MRKPYSIIISLIALSLVLYVFFMQLNELLHPIDPISLTDLFADYYFFNFPSLAAIPLAVSHLFNPKKWTLVLLVAFIAYIAFIIFVLFPSISHFH